MLSGSEVKMMAEHFIARFVVRLSRIQSVSLFSVVGD